MSLVNLPIIGSQLNIIRSLGNRLLYISDDDPREYMHGLFSGFSINIDNNGNIFSGEIPKSEPSTIFTRLDIRVKYDQIDALPYFPSYAAMKPEQRFTYLMWLTDITMPIDTGYVFTYYYGLERQLLAGDFDKAFSEILTLRMFHKNKSFIGYSEDGLLNALLLKGRFDKLIEIQKTDELNRLSEFQFEILYKNNLSLSPRNFIEVMMGFSKINKSLVKTNWPKYETCVCEIFNNRYGIEGMPITEIVPIRVYEKRRVQAFINFSFPDNIRFTEVFDFYRSNDLFEAIKSVHTDANTLFKKKNK